MYQTAAQNEIENRFFGPKGIPLQYLYRDLVINSVKTTLTNSIKNTVTSVSSTFPNGIHMLVTFLVGSSYTI